MSIINLTDYGYSKSEYDIIRQNNREYVKLNPDKANENFQEFMVKYEISIKGEVYYLNHWIKGLKAIRKKYGVKIFNFQSFSLLFSLKMSLPQDIDYVLATDESKYNEKVVYKYISHEACFELLLSFDDWCRYTVYYGDEDLIKGGHYGV